MYSELFRIMEKDSTFDKSVYKNPSVTRQKVAGIYVSVRLDSNGSIVYVRCKKDDDMMIGIMKNNQNIFPKYNFNYGHLTLENTPLIDNEVADFTKTIIKVDASKTDLDKPLKYASDLLKRFTDMGKLETAMGKLLVSVSKIEDIHSLFSSIFSIIKEASLTDKMANDFLKEIVKVKSTGKKATVKIPIIFSYSENGVSSLDSDDYTLDLISRVVEMPLSKMVSYGNTKVEIYENLPKYKFPCGISNMYIFARNTDAPSMSVYGKYGSDTFVLPVDKCNSILSYLDHILPVNGENNSFIPVGLSRFKKGILAVVFNEESCKKNIVRFFSLLDKDEKDFEVERYKKELIDSVKNMKENDKNLDSPVEILLIGAVDKASVGLVSSLILTKQKVLDRIVEWNEAGLPRPVDLIKCMRANSKQDRDNIKYTFEKNRCLFGYDSLLEFSFGENPQLNLTILKKLIDNLKAYVVSYSNVKTNKIGEEQIKFLKHVAKRMEKTEMSDNYKTLGRILAFSDELQLKYWKEKKIDGVNQRTIGSQAIQLVMQGRTKDAFMGLLRSIEPYARWASSTIRNKQDKGQKYDTSLEYVLNVIRGELSVTKKIELEKFFSVRPTDIDMANVMIEYVSR